MAVEQKMMDDFIHAIKESKEVLEPHDLYKMAQVAEKAVEKRIAKKAAAELKESIRKDLFKEGLSEEREQLADTMLDYIVKEFAGEMIEARTQLLGEELTEAAKKAFVDEHIEKLKEKGLIEVCEETEDGVKIEFNAAAIKAADKETQDIVKKLFFLSDERRLKPKKK